MAGSGPSLHCNPPITPSGKGGEVIDASNLFGQDRVTLARSKTTGFHRPKICWGTASRESRVYEMKVITNKIGTPAFTDAELEIPLAVMRPACERETALPANVIHLEPRALRNRKRPARV
jgi:hypothetical protein